MSVVGDKSFSLEWPLDSVHVLCSTCLRQHKGRQIQDPFVTFACSVCGTGISLWSGVVVLLFSVHNEPCLEGTDQDIPCGVCSVSHALQLG